MAKKKQEDPERTARIMALLDDVLELDEEIVVYRDTLDGVKEDLKGAKKRLDAKLEERRKLFDQMVALRKGIPYQSGLDLEGPE